MLLLKNRKIKQKVIRLRKKGNIYYPIYDIVITFKDRRNRGKYFEKLGFFNPHISERVFIINSGRMAYWISHGVIINNTVKKYLVKFLVK